MSTTVPFQRPTRTSIELSLGVLAHYPGATALITADGATPSIGGDASAIIDTLHVNGAWPAIVAATRRCLALGTALVETVGSANPGSAFEVTLLPLATGSWAASGAGSDLVLALFRPLAFESALRLSLIESRQRYRSLVELAADFAWETDADGRFRFVSPGGALGWTAQELVGRPATELLLDPTEADGAATVFAARQPARDVDLWLRRVDGGSDCVAVTAMPIGSDDGVWSGARGLCRIVTSERKRSEESAQARLHDRLIGHLTRTIRDEIDPEHALAAALSATGLALAASGGAILRNGQSGELTLLTQWGPTTPSSFIFAAAAMVAAGGGAELYCGGMHVVGGPTKFQGQRNGVALLWREGELGPFAAEDQAILGDVTTAFGATIAQLINHECTMLLARTDALTGLLNRRGFTTEATRRLTRLARSTHPACLLFVDLDNFKLVNDRRGHQAGDVALRAVAQILHDNSRSGDLIARLGGDEFAMWLDGATVATATRRAEAILAAMIPLGELSADQARPFSASIGIAVHDPERSEDPEQLLARADAAMYRAKRGGKARIAYADATEAAPSAQPASAQSVSVRQHP